MKKEDLEQVMLPEILGGTSAIYDSAFSFTDDMVRNKYARFEIVHFWKNRKNGQLVQLKPAKIHTCKELIVAEAIKFFRTTGKHKYRPLNIRIKTHKDYINKVITIINQFEVKVLKLKNCSKFFMVNNKEDEVYIEIARRWHRSPLSYYTLLLLIKTSPEVDETATFEENYELLCNAKTENESGAGKTQVQQFHRVKSLFDALVKNGFEYVFGESVNFKGFWYLDPKKGSKVRPQDGSSIGPSSLYDMKNSWDMNKDSWSSNERRNFIDGFNKKFQSLTDCFMTDILSMDFYLDNQEVAGAAITDPNIPIT